MPSVLAGRCSTVVIYVKHKFYKITTYTKTNIYFTYLMPTQINYRPFVDLAH